MKNMLRRTFCAALSAAILISLCFAGSYGNSVDSSSKAVSGGALFCRGAWLSSSTPQSENYIVYTPNDTVSPVTAYGSKLYGTSTYQTTASWLRSQGYDVTAAVNGDFFNTVNGLPNGIAVTDGVVRGSDGYQNAVGFRADGTAVIGKPSMNMRAVFPSGETAIFSINRALSDAGIFLYTPDFSATTRSVLKTQYVILDTGSGALKMSGSLTGSVTDSVTSSQPIDIPQGRMILAAVSGTKYADALSALKTGDSVSIRISCAAGWEDVQYAIGANQLLLQNGSVPSGLDSAAAPRTAVGIKADGSVLFYTVDGRQSGLSRGVGLGTLAERLKELGCVSALNLDGGGSTVMAVKYPGRDDLETVNSPSDGSLRKCANFIFLVNRAPSTGTAAALHIYPYDARLMTGASRSFTALAVDSGWHSVPTGQVTYSCSGGSITDDGLWTAPAQPGTYTVSASASGVTGGLEVQVFSPDELVITSRGSDVTSGLLTVSRGSQSQFSVTAYNAGRELVSDSSLFEWSLTGAAGTVTPEGCLTAVDSADGAAGRLTVSRDGVSAWVDIKVPGTVKLLEDFEGEYVPGAGTSVEAMITGDLPNVKYGLKAAALTYSAPEGSPASLDFAYELSDGRPYMCMWVKGDGSGSALYALFDNGSQELICPLSGTDWRFASVRRPADSSGTVSLLIQSDGGSGTIYIDSVHANSGGGEDDEPPVVSASPDGSAVVRDPSELDKSFVTVTLDSRPVDFAFDPDTGYVKADLPQKGGLSVFTVVCRDAVGNLASSSVTLGASSGCPFPDSRDHWAAGHIEYLYNRGIAAGSLDSGVLRYRPDSPITRAEFAVMVSRWLGADTAAYEDVPLAFADAGDIPSWAVPHVKAMVSKGVITGTLSGRELLFAPWDELTRTQAMTMLGRTQPMGWGGSLSVYSDGPQVPAWAALYVAQLTGRGTVSGSGGYVRPMGSVTRAEVAKMISALS